MNKINYCFINEDIIYVTDSIEKSIKDLTVVEEEESYDNDSNNIIIVNNNNSNSIFKPDEGFKCLGEGIYAVIKEIFPDKTKVSDYLENKKGFLYSEILQKKIEEFSKEFKKCNPISIQLSGQMTKEEIREALGSSQENKEIEKVVDYIYKELNKNNEEKKI